MRALIFALMLVSQVAISAEQKASPPAKPTVTPAVVTPPADAKPTVVAKSAVAAKPPVVVATSSSRPASARSGSARSLEDIHIEGEIPVPQVLFITARDQRRFLDFNHRRYLKTSREVGAGTALPSRVALASPRPDSTQGVKPQ
ncbi:MAG: hypothetical protein HOP12_05005 [Candidatus Eisenbacteria bacterium]|uniref:Uncharacterized protein n=1 Tax=Eiseniibacteriota bacterium TaxID=2212470 RepID=A0A849SLP2_UNCEI|nr:hypothetical protein [Candidatus Eisenbacteria bacterium]